MKKLTWLHLTDLHQGMERQNWLWPTVRSAFYSDLERVLRKVGSFDLVFFTGDLTQKSSSEEFSLLTETLEELWSVFKKLGQSPYFIPVPGNHDSKRPERANPYAKLMQRSWHTDQDIQKDFWENKDSEYKKLVFTAFEPYTKWLENLSIPKPPRNIGCIPGDFSSIYDREGLRVGIIGLNSAFLQLSDFDYEGQLDIGEPQLHVVCEGDAEKWCNKNHINILLTHHPISWLEPAARDRFRMDIAPPGRFIAHLCGHLHTTLVESISEAGAERRRLIQGRSLFGLEYYHQNGQERPREHGYSAGKIEIQDEIGRLFLWPRQNIKGYAGQLRIAPDQGFELNDNEAIEESFELRSKLIQELLDAQDTDADNIDITSIKTELAIQSNNTNQADLPNIVEAPPDRISSSERLASVPRWSIRPASQHLEVRTPEQNSFKTALIQRRAVWLVADWGLGKEGFLFSIIATEKIPRELEKIPREFFRLNCDGVNSIELLSSEATKQWGMTFQEFCLNISNLPATTLLLDDLPEEGAVRHSEGWARRLDEIVQAALDLAPNLNIILSCRIMPGPSRFSVTRLRPLDEPDCVRYIKNHPDGGEALANPRTIEKLYANSEGVPMHLDRLLGQLQSVSLEDLDSTDIEASHSRGEEPIPKSLTQAISTLQNSDNRYTKRTLRLLKILTILSHGEIFQNLKRFDPTEPFFPDNVKQLHDLALIEVIPLVALGADPNHREKASANDPSAPKLLVVPRPVKDYVRSLMVEDERRSIVSNALDIYFGSRWREGKPSLQSLTQIVVWENGTSGIGNHQSVLALAIKDCIALKNQALFKQIFRITEAYLEALKTAAKFRELLQAAEELFRLLAASESRREASKVAYYYGLSLRMLDRKEEAIRIHEDALANAPTDSNKSWQARVYLDLAMAYKSTGDNASAIKAAKEVQSRTEKHSGFHNQAKAVLIECELETGSKTTSRQELIELEKDARKSDQLILANNLAIGLARLEENATSKINWLDIVITSNPKRDRYNHTRAVVEKTKILLKQKQEEKLGLGERKILKGAYSYLYSQRFGKLFDDCHDALWDLARKEMRKTELLRIFRFSSFLWRIYGQHQREMDYLSQLKKLLPTTPTATPSTGEEVGFVYYLSRLTSLGD